MFGTAFEAIIGRFPNCLCLADEEAIPQEDFDRQKTKHLAAGGIGGAIGVIQNSAGEVILTRRSGMHAGWALPGGTIETGEDAMGAFLREVLEEIGIVPEDPRLVIVERKDFLSPQGERLPFTLAVFAARYQDIGLPPATANAVQEGIQAQLFAPDSLPAEMILKDREKLDLCLADTDYF